MLALVVQKLVGTVFKLSIATDSMAKFPEETSVFVLKAKVAADALLLAVTKDPELIIAITLVLLFCEIHLDGQFS
jgi:hypothetical protein